MRIAYLAPYQGLGLQERRPVIRNLSLANNIKLELVSRLLRRNSHQIEVLSEGGVAEQRLRFYPGFREPKPFDPEIPVFYASAIPVRRFRALWSSFRMLLLFRARHRAAPFDLVIIWNVEQPKVVCASFARRRLRIPVVLQYEDDAFVDVRGKPARNVFGGHRYIRSVMREVSGCMACSPHLLSQTPPRIPKLLLRGVVGEDLLMAAQESGPKRRNRVLFSGTHCRQYGLPSLIAAWQQANLSDWELHITGQGPESDMLRKLTEGVRGIYFHGLVPRSELVRLMCSASVCVNPQDVSEVQGNVFSFKVIEYLASGAHVITTRMGALEEDFERGITYIPQNDPATIASALVSVTREQRWENSVAQSVWNVYGPAAAAKSLHHLVTEVATRGAVVNGAKHGL